MRSKEYVLEQLDRWYSKRFQAYYTPEVALHISKGLEQRAREMYIQRGFPPEREPRELIKAFSKKFSRKSQVREATKFFTKNYSTLEVLMEEDEEKPLQALMTFHIPSEVRKKAKKNAYLPFSRMKAFVDILREKAENKLWERISSYDIDSAFMKTFRNAEGFTQLGAQCKLAEALQMEYKESIGALEPGKYQSFLDIAGVMNSAIPEISRAVFSTIGHEEPQPRKDILSILYEKILGKLHPALS